MKNDGNLGTDLIAATNSLMADDTVQNFDVSVNKRTGIARLKAVSRDGRVMTQEAVGPGLTVRIDYTPEDKRSRDANIIALRQRGLTQTETGRMLNVSQALVAKVESRLKNSIDVDPN